MREWEASISVPWCTIASSPFKGAASIGVPWYTNASSILIRHAIRLVSIFRLFLIPSLIFPQLFRGLLELCFLLILYARTSLDF